MAKKLYEEEVEVAVEEKVDPVAEARARRLQMAGVTPEQAERDIREQFRLYFTKIKRTLGLPSEMEEILWLHLKAIGHNKIDKFESGIANFGYKV